MFSMSFAVLWFSTVAHAIVGGSTIALPHLMAQSTVMVLQGSKGAGLASLCSGTIVSDKFILTADHCINKRGLQAFVIFAPSVAAATTDDYYGVRAIHRFPHNGVLGGFSSRHDIGLVELKTQIPAGYKPAVLVTDGAPNLDHHVLWAAGYGKTSDRTKVIDTGTLRAVEVKLHGYLGEGVGEFSYLVYPHRFFPDLLVLDQSGGKGTCQGDSGGPIYDIIKNQLHLVGVIKSTSNCFDKAFVTNPYFPDYFKWIKSKVFKR